MYELSIDISQAPELEAALRQLLASAGFGDFAEEASAGRQDDVSATPQEAPTERFLLYRSDEASLAALQRHVERQCSGVRCAIIAIDEEAWRHSWQDDVSAFETKRFRIAFGAEFTPTQDPRDIVLLQRGVFGDGRHATTQACLTMMEDFDFAVGGQGRFLDIGCGTGVLNVAASRLGFSQNVATDLDPDAIAAAAANAQANGIGLRTYLGTFPDAQREAPFDLIACNILYPELRCIAAEVASWLTAQGRLITAGLTRRHVDEFATLLADNGLALIKELAVRGWVALAFIKVPKEPAVPRP